MLWLAGFALVLREAEASALLASLGIAPMILTAKDAGVQFQLEEKVLSSFETEQLVFTGVKRTPSQAQQDMYFSHVL